MNPHPAGCKSNTLGKQLIPNLPIVDLFPGLNHCNANLGYCLTNLGATKDDMSPNQIGGVAEKGVAGPRAADYKTP